MKRFFLILFMVQYFSCAVTAGDKNKEFYLPDYIHPEQIQIVRDSFGVPHIFAPTDAEVIYGLAWATMEDDAETAQYLFLASKGLLGRHAGIDGAIIDYAVQLTRVRDIASDYLKNDCKEDFKKIVESYCAGANAYFVNHWDEFSIKRGFPIEPVDVISGYMLGLALMGGVDGALKSIVEEKLASKIPSMPEYPVIGSNAFAFNDKITTDGNTYLDINSHQPLEGLLSWYEAHLCSEEGLNITGSLFHGGLSIFHGTNEKLGWAHTVGEFDKSDIFVLKMKDNKSDYYQYGKEWKKLEKSHAKLRVGLGKHNNLIIPVRKKIWWSEFGPTLKTKEGVFALKMPSLLEPGAAEQWFRMNKTQNLNEFKSVMSAIGLTQMNTCYADVEGNIYLVANGLIPKRKNGHDWSKPVWGTPESNWNTFYSIEELAHFENPECGYVFNTNNSAFHGTAYEENLDPKSFNKNMGYNLEVNNRSARFYEMMENYEKVSWDDFLAIKFDHTYAKDTFYFLRDFSIMEVFDISTEQNPDLTEAMKHFDNWNWKTDSLNRDFPVILYTFLEIYNRSGGEKTKLYRENKEARVKFFTDCVRLAKNHMMATFGTLDIPLSKVQVLERGGKTVPVNGGPDNIRAAIGDKMEDGRLRLWIGDSFIQVVKFTKDGPEIYSVSPFGASNRKDSPHYNDQMELFSQQKFKKMSLDKNYWLQRAEAIYNPK